jgi:cephalosporin hydroxylase
MFMEQYLDMPVRELLAIMQDRIVNNTSYFGVKALKSPADSWVYQEIMYEMKPDVIVEIGVNHGGGTLKLAHFCDSLNKGRVIGIDISLANVPPIVRAHPRITLIEKDAQKAFYDFSRLVSPDDRILVIEDSAHTYENTLNVLRTYSILIKPGDYFIVEDSICWHGLDLGPKPGPYEAIEQFVSENKDFVVDRSRENFFITWNPKGYLKRVR